MPLLVAYEKLSSTLAYFENKRLQLQKAHEEADKKLSWWNQFNYGGVVPDFGPLDSQIRKLEKAKSDFEEHYKNDMYKVHHYFEKLTLRTTKRIKEVEEKLILDIEKEQVKKISNTSLASAWLATLSIPVSIIDDVYTANEVYDTLRAVNSNYEGMSNSEVWWETLWLSPESHAGLVSLTKGAYFEQLVSEDMSGQLHDHFNAPGTDIIVNGTEMQIKATDSVAYINTVDDDIPVIATSEVAQASSAIDSGYSNEELANTVNNALGNSVFDAKDTAIDAILTGVGSLGIFATIKGINHACTQYKSGRDGGDSLFEGLGIAIEGTIKGIFDFAELLYKILYWPVRVFWVVLRFIFRIFIK